jgi:Fibronectin type III domain
VFPDRDFVSIDGYQDKAGQLATITVTRGGVITGRAEGPIAADSPALEANHPGGVCWGTGAGAPDVTPDILPGDVVTVSFNGVVADSSVTQGPSVTGTTHTPGTTQLVVNGTLGTASGPVAAPGRMEQRIIEPLLVPTDVHKRDIRAVEGPLTRDPSGGYSSSLEFTATTFKATYVFDLASSADIAAGGEKRAMTWMATDPADNRLGMTISEFGLTGGPGMGGCPQGPTSTAPNAPANVSGTPGDASLTATWGAATTIPGGSPVTGYVVEVQSPDDPNAPVFRRIVAAADRSVLVTGLTNGTAYDVRVNATSAAGPGLVGTGVPVTPSPLPTTAPGAPAIGTATGGNASATVSWSRPAGVVDSFTVEASTGGAVVQTIPLIAGSAASTLVTGLTNGTSYTFTVTALNAVGSSLPSAASNVVTPAVPVTVAVAPAIGVATAGNAAATIPWTAPANAATSAITGYRIQRYAGTGTAVLGTTTVGTTLRSATVTGLANGTAVRFDVTAVTGTTFGAVSAKSNVVTPVAPVTVALAPAIGVATAANTSALTRWTAPANAATSAVTGYRIRRYAGAGTTVLATTTVGSTLRSATLTGLVNGTAVRFDVTAVSGTRFGAVSAKSNVVTPATTAPGAPVIGTSSPGAVGGVVNATARWTPPVSNGGVAIDGYVVTALRVDAAGTVLARTTSLVQPAASRALVMALTAGNYRFTVQARNTRGLGVASARSLNLVTAR